MTVNKISFILLLTCGTQVRGESLHGRAIERGSGFQFESASEGGSVVPIPGKFVPNG